MCSLISSKVLFMTSLKTLSNNYAVEVIIMLKYKKNRIRKKNRNILMPSCLFLFLLLIFSNIEYRDILLGEEIEHLIVDPTVIIDRENAEEYLNPDSPY